ncbi:hypothetical protein [Kluyvera intermedia]|uniref:Uncharacterized protein n=1 Tax=Kluyvera intermedia TaxID=61648 RepID=A0ABX6DRK5_KLUIN|nr:hypothetical protein [Kluyvera intermedia]QGH31064.1 hypothetical protein GHC21_15925 [Kluyvera intermedia]QGH40046.1 hypothetical protein GHC38_15925 [Kluyvera intermedia]
MTINNKKNLHTRFYFLFIFIITLLFFTIIHPVTIISGDDWQNMAASRSIFPEWGGFNPIKVMPELSFPFSARVASTLIMPFGFDFLTSVMIITAILTATILTIFLYQTYLFIVEKFDVTSFSAKAATFIFFLCFFGLFKTKDNSNSSYLLWEINITCYYHYIYPALINSSFVLFLMRQNKGDNILKKDHALRNATICLVSYVCIFSSVFANIILCSYSGLMLLIGIYEHRLKLIDALKANLFHVFILLLWIMAVVFEGNGGRASQIESSNLQLVSTIQSVDRYLSSIDLFYFYTLLFGVVAALSISLSAYIFKKDKKIANEFICMAVLWLLSTIALLLICAKSSPSYAERPAAIFAFYLYPILISTSAIARMMQTNKLVFVSSIIAIFSMLNIATSTGTSLKESHNLNLNFHKAKLVGQHIIDQAQSAEANGARSVTIFVPKGNNYDNWPFPTYMGKRLSKTLKVNGLIENTIDIKIVPDSGLNEKYGIPFH